uniref:WWE domain-containing protein n=1 Tax=Eutreptiella gymnastica TaxID=73025 RepID=A0A7S1JE71_9EUGL|mmetsp:Transcript_90447/g.156710  ORF Transcript_90447/g.156710 Transcript_90447/m.156710 type:complete len:114 (+) Transcript_90447:73-414(+)
MAWEWQNSYGEWHAMDKKSSLTLHELEQNKRQGPVTIEHLGDLYRPDLKSMVIIRAVCSPEVPMRCVRKAAAPETFPIRKNPWWSLWEEKCHHCPWHDPLSGIMAHRVKSKGH